MTAKTSIPGLYYLAFSYYNGFDTYLLDNTCLLLKVKDLGEGDRVELNNRRSESGLVF